MTTMKRPVRRQTAPTPGVLLHEHDCPAGDDPRIEAYTVRDAQERPVKVTHCIDCGVTANGDAPLPSDAA